MPMSSGAHEPDCAGDGLVQIGHDRERHAAMLEMPENRGPVVENDRQVHRAGERGVEERKIVFAALRAVPLDRGASEEETGFVEARPQRLGHRRLERAGVKFRADEHHVAEPLPRSAVAHRRAQPAARENVALGNEALQRRACSDSGYPPVFEG